MSALHPLSREEWIAWAGHARWVEARLFETLGAWVADVPEPAVRVALARHAAHHGWHAQVWAERLAGLGAGDPEAATRPSGDGWRAFAAAVSRTEPDGPGATVERVAGVYRVLVPAVIAGYAEHLARAGPVADAPVARALRLLLLDEEDDRREGEALLGALLDSPEGRERAARRARDLRALLPAAGAR